MKSKIGALEEVVLLAVQGSEPKSNGAAVLRMLQAVGHGVTVGAAHITLERLADKGLIERVPGEQEPRQGGRIRRYYGLTEDGRAALNEAEVIRAKLRAQVLAGGTR